MDKGKLLDRLGAAGEDRLVLAKILDRAEQARSRNIPAATDFLSPAQLAQAGDLLRLAGFPETGYAALGGYEGAERRLLLFLPDWLEMEDAESQSPIRCLRAAFRAAAPGRTSREFITSRPTHVMDRVTTTAMETENTVSCQNTRTPRLSARAGWTAESMS